MNRASKLKFASHIWGPAAFCAALAVGGGMPALAQVPPGFLQETTGGPPPDPDPHALRGVYVGGVPGKIPSAKVMAPYNKAALVVLNQRVAAMNSGADRPDPQVYCETGGAVRFAAGGFPVRFITTPGLITIIAEEDHVVRRIYLDQPHPAHIVPSIIGDSVGHWDGNTLVVDTIGFKDGGWMDEYGSPSSDKLHLRERFTKTRAGREIDDEITIDDPVNYTAPFVYLHKYTYAPNATWDEMICEENNRNVGPLP